ncbi:MAG: class I SAM-dependent methyltransferase [Candidatus Krumholzibacteriota bacterium]|nr:class I SAM-dependent methyltransferase [Candidatus Krumholzibacteriota bacterium]
MLSFFSEALERYIDEHATGEPALFRELAEETRRRTAIPQMMVGNTEGLLLRSLVRICDAHRVLEVGTFTGYSTLAMAMAMPEGAELITCDIDPEVTSIARSFWDRSPHGKKISLRMGPALDTIAGLSGPFDLVFIDADKQNYINYWDACVPLVRRHGVIVVDNVLWSGRVVDPTDERDEETRAIVAFNKHAHADDRMEHVMLSVRDGITLAVRL